MPKPATQSKVVRVSRRTEGPVTSRKTRSTVAVTRLRAWVSVKGSMALFMRNLARLPEKPQKVAVTTTNA